MRIWLQTFVSIQPRTSLEKSDVSWPTACCSLELQVAVDFGAEPSPRSAAARAAGPRGFWLLRIRAASYRSLEGSFSAGSTATIATKYSFFQVFRDLQNYLAKFSKILQNFEKNQRFSEKSAFFFAKIRKFRKFL